MNKNDLLINLKQMFSNPVNSSIKLKKIKSLYTKVKELNIPDGSEVPNQIMMEYRKL
jgi:hypothetical protein